MGRISTLIAATREVLATRDLSTGLLKRAAFEKTVEDWVGGGDARRPATTLLMIQVGIAGAPLAERPDQALLINLAKDVTTLLRATDIVGRVDEDTLGVLLPSTPVDQGVRAAERILETFRGSTRAQKGNLAATIGVSGAGSLEPWLAALQALREARLAGGDRVVLAPDARPADLTPSVDPDTAGSPPT
ncbi:MAG: diguanylate cyclase [Solirubrobacteraceae bacterium]|nr:diguanylate cyclase [Patulibacter sp.]